MPNLNLIDSIIDDKPVNLSIIKGKSWNNPVIILKLNYPTDIDYSSWTPKATIRDNYKSLPNNEIVEFDFLPLSFYVDTGDNNKTKLLVVPYLTYDKTKDLEPTEYQGEENKLKVGKAYVWDLELVSPDQSTVIAVIDASFVRIKYEVT